MPIPLGYRGQPGYIKEGYKIILSPISSSIADHDQSLVVTNFIHDIPGQQIELAIPFVLNYDPEDYPQQARLGDFMKYHPSE
ncbi:hypothetical protein TNCV_3552171 [Trichonephila clavipes]|nr:hypothetical protein TNCV_3552171 [Trichonephila clavipes]